jgi:Tfp pilus assembly protein FimT
MSPIVVLALVFILTVFAVAVFVAVVVAIRSEAHDEMATKAQGPLTAMVRRLLGVYVGRPADTDVNDDREECLTGNSTDWWNNGGWDR